MSRIIQSETFNALENTILDIYTSASIDPTLVPAQPAFARGNADHATLTVAREARDNATFLAVVVENGEGKDITQVHKLGLYVTGTTLLLDSKGSVTQFQELLDGDVLGIGSFVKQRYDSGAFNKKRWLRSLLTRS